ncbi:MAG: hypothetical protein ACI9T9_000738, partial [Oleiphilaceae bacterium]
ELSIYFLIDFKEELAIEVNESLKVGV